MKERNDLNTVEICGVLDRDVELRYTSNGTPVINVVLLYTFRHNEKEKPSRFDVVQFGPAAEDLAQQLKKGVAVEVYGRLETASWEDHDGNTRSKVQIVAKSIEIIDL
jgi:single-strand DNA-binding protein